MHFSNFWILIVLFFACYFIAMSLQRLETRNIVLKTNGKPVFYKGQFVEKILLNSLWQSQSADISNPSKPAIAKSWEISRKGKGENIEMPSADISWIIIISPIRNKKIISIVQTSHTRRKYLQNFICTLWLFIFSYKAPKNRRGFLYKIFSYKIWHFTGICWQLQVTSLSLWAPWPPVCLGPIGRLGTDRTKTKGRTKGGLWWPERTEAKWGPSLMKGPRKTSSHVHWISLWPLVEKCPSPSSRIQTRSHLKCRQKQ